MESTRSTEVGQLVDDSGSFTFSFPIEFDLGSIIFNEVVACGIV